MLLDAVCYRGRAGQHRRSHRHGAAQRECVRRAAPLFSEDRMQKKPRGEKLEPATYWTTAEEKAAAQKEAKRRGMTGSQLVRLAVANEIKRGGK